ncbi:putative membrane protein YvoD [Spirochaetia bacterium]|nr:putative membrane protein YvoD [Spirochaetia bacterium]GHU33063.1 putative membrane protein YvoD [Spirochaetia bacterium]
MNSGLFKRAGAKTMKPALTTIRILLVITIPASFAVVLLEESGILFYFANVISPFMRLFGLSGEASLVFISSVFLNIYAAVAVVKTLHLPEAEVIILATMCFIAHNFPVECLVLKKTGSSLIEMICFRIISAFAVGWILHFLISAPGQIPAESVHAVKLGIDWNNLSSRLIVWAKETGVLALRIFIMVFSILFLQKVLDEAGIMKKLGILMLPFMRIMGLPASCGYGWIVAQFVGLAYGAAVFIESTDSGEITRNDADIFNHHISINHSQIEDTFLFVSIGVPYLWAVIPRFLYAILAVWCIRVGKYLFRKLTAA